MFNHIKDPEGKTVFQESGSNLKSTIVHVVPNKESDSSVESLKLQIQHLEQTVLKRHLSVFKVLSIVNKLANVVTLECF